MTLLKLADDSGGPGGFEEYEVCEHIIKIAEMANAMHLEVTPEVRGYEDDSWYCPEHGCMTSIYTVMEALQMQNDIQKSKEVKEEEGKKKVQPVRDETLLPDPVEYRHNVKEAKKE